MKLASALNFSHQLLKAVVQKGDHVIYATIRNENDTLFLSKLVGKYGKVYGFDIQMEAIQNTQNKLTQNHVTCNVKLYHTGHENILKNLKDEKINAAIFNLGYLLGGNKQIITHSNTTIQAINACLKLLKQKGIVILVIYYGHSGGKDEKIKLEKYASQLPSREYNVLKYECINSINEPPILIAIQKN